MGSRTIDFILKRTIGLETTPPFLGLVPLDDERRQEAIMASRSFLQGDAARLPNLFKSFPYVAAWIVAQGLTSEYGEGDYAIYRHIEEATQVKLDTQQKRRALYEAFCTVCNRLGLPTRGFERMVDVYLLQAGVPLALLPQVIDAFLRQEAAFGAPPTEATVLLNRWEDDSLYFLSPTVITPRRTILWDESAYHAALYARIRSDGSGFVPAHPFESRFFEILSDKIAGSGPTLTAAAVAVPRPKLIWQEGGVRILVPKVEGRFNLWPERDDKMLRLRGGEAWSISQPWPHEMRWQAGSHGGEISFLSSPGAFAAFDLATGHLTKESSNSAGQVELDATDAVLLARVAFSVAGEPALEADASSFVAFVRLGPRPTMLRLNGREVALRARPRRRLIIHGGEIATGSQGSLHGAGATLRVETGLARVEQRWLRITLAGRSVDMLQEIGTEGTADLSLPSLLALFSETCPQDPTRLRVELMAPTEGGTGPGRTAGIVASAWVWPGFRRMDGLILESTGPLDNWVAAQSHHMARDSRGRLCLDHAGGYAAARAVFEIGDGFIPFDLPWPDVTISRQRSDGMVQFLSPGTRLSVGPEARFDTITIRCPDPAAALTVRGREEARPFALGIARNLAMRTLIEPASDDRVILHRANGNELLLLQVVSALDPQHFDVSRDRDGLSLRFVLSTRVEAVRFELEDEEGTLSVAEAELTHRPASPPPPYWLSAQIDPGNSAQVDVKLATSPFADGVTLARIVVRLNGEDRWRPLRTGRGDTFAIALTSPAGDALWVLDALERRFETLTRWLADCYSENCWTQIERVLLPRWQSLGRALVAMPTGAGAVMRAAAVPPPDHVAPSWVPINHPLQFIPDLYAAPAEDFAALAASQDAGVAELAAVFYVGSGRIRDLADLHPTVFLAFQNGAVAQATGVQLRGFRPERHLRNLAHPQIDVDPSAGWFWRGRPLLGPDHWRAAHLRFAERLESAGMFIEGEAEDGANSKRKEVLQRLIFRAWQTTLAEARPPAPKRNATDLEPDSVDLWASALLCGFARACRMGQVRDFVAPLAKHLGREPKEVLITIGLLLRLAPELFAFFMLLWQIAKDRS
jgi:hypothetical protein